MLPPPAPPATTEVDGNDRGSDDEAGTVPAAAEGVLVSMVALTAAVAAAELSLPLPAALNGTTPETAKESIVEAPSEDTAEASLLPRTGRCGGRAVTTPEPKCGAGTTAAVEVPVEEVGRRLLLLLLVCEGTAAAIVAD